MQFRRTLLLAFGIAALLRGQSSSFDVASLKPVQLTGADRYNANLGSASHGEVALINATLSDCLRYAYGITNDAQIAGPDWIRNKDIRFDILAKAPPDTPLDQLLLMLQTLLTERFQLVLHREPRELSFVALTVAKSGLKMSKAKPDALPPKQPQIPGRIVSSQMTLNKLTTLLSRFLRQTVPDETGLTGPYDIDLQWSPDAEQGPSVFTAVQQQLGLKLESRKAPVEVLVIDQAEKTPIAN